MDVRARRIERENARRHAEMLRVIRTGENAWRSEIEKLRAALRLIALSDDAAYMASVARAALGEEK